MDVVSEVKSRLDLVEYVGHSVALQKAGRNFRGLCPFHSEKTPSFYVFPDRQSWRCFGSCGEGGDILTFAQKQSGLQFRDALRELAQLAGVPMGRENAEQRSRIERLASIVSAAVDYYERKLEDSEAAEARAYVFEKRGISPQTAAAFHIGWAPNEWRGLRDHLLGRGYAEQDCIDAGLLIEGERGNAPYDRFRGRVIIPIADDRGVFVGLGGRGIDGEEPKYLNSPQSDLFDKGRTLFGWHLAAESAREAGTIVVVEGYMDVIGPWQAGFKNVVATMGTSLTEQHASLLRRLARRVVLAMDPDSAGMAAAERAGSLFIGSGTGDELGRAAQRANEMSLASEIELRVARMPAGKDPDEVARDAPDEWERAIDSATPYGEFLLSRLLPGIRPDSMLDRQRLVKQTAPIVRAAGGPIDQARYVSMVAGRLGIDEAAVWEAVRPRRLSNREYMLRNAATEKPRVSHEDRLLATLLRHPGLRSHVRILPPDLFSEGINRELFRTWIAEQISETSTDDDPLVDKVRSLEAMRLPEVSSVDARRLASDYIRAILNERLLERHAALTQDLSELEERLGVNRLAEMGFEAWRGSVMSDESEALVSTTLENLELGLSLHRRETHELV